MTTRSKLRSAGRPPARRSENFFWENEPHAFLLERLNHIPDLIVGERIQVKKLAKLVHRCDFTVYRWFTENRVPAGGARMIVKIANDRITPEEMVKFVLA